MEEVIGWLLGAIAVIAVVGAILWIVVALVVRAVSLVVVYWVVLAFVGLAAGLIGGVLLPLRVLRGKGKGELWQIVPEDVVQGRVLRDKPRGPNREYGWDRAWPNYIPQQAKQDALAVGREVQTHLTWFWSWAASKSRGKASGSTTKPRGANLLFSKLARRVPGVVWWLIILPGMLTYAVGLYISCGVWLLVMGVVGALATLLQACGLGLSKLGDVSRRRRRRASVKCPFPPCYGESSLPGYRCSNPACPVVHWTMLPGPLGLRRRRCECGQVLPNTVTGAARKLQPVCPYCQKDLPIGGGSRQTIQIAVVGSTGAGKSRLLDAMTVTLDSVMKAIGGTLSPLSERSAAYHRSATARLRERTVNAKTDDAPPIGLPFVISHRSTQIETQVLDVAGEAYATWDDTARLRYLDNAHGLIMVVDPLALPGVYDEFRRSTFFGTVMLAEGDQEEAYGSAVDRMRADQVRTDRRGLAVVLTKGDILVQLPIAADLAPSDSDSVRQWLVLVGADLMVRRFEKDFRQVSFFVTDAMDARPIQDPLSPWMPFDWLLKECNAAITIDVALPPAA